MNTLTGLGIWVWNWGACEKGDAGAIAAKAKASGFDWIAVRSGESNADGTVTPARVAALRSAGLRVVGWWYSLPRTELEQLDQARALVGMGIDALIVDAELEWEADKQPDGSWKSRDYRSQAFDFGHKLRAVVGEGTYLADAPWPKPKSHPLWPFAEFGSVMDARHPQAYWGMSGEPFAEYAPEWEAQWAALRSAVPVCPIAQTISADWKHRAPLLELGSFLERYGSRPARSIWAWPSTSAEEWAFLAARASTPIPNPLAGDTEPLVIPGGTDDEPPPEAA